MNMSNFKGAGIFEIVASTNTAIKPYEGKFCVVSENHGTHQLRLHIVNTETVITTSPCVNKTELGEMIVAQTENSAYFLRRVGTV